MANNTLFEKKDVKLTKDQAIKKLKRAWNAGKDKEIMEIKKQYSGDFEAVFRKVFGEESLETYAFDVENYLTEGAVWMGINTNKYQADLDRFHVFCLVLYMIDKGEFLPESILDERLMARINLACDALGYDDLYHMDKDEKGKFIVDTTKKCYNPKSNLDLDKMKNQDIADLYREQLDDIADYKERVGKFDWDALVKAMEDEENAPEEEIDYRPGTPKWMIDIYNKGVRDRNEKRAKGEKTEDEEEETANKKTKKDPKKKDDSEFVVKKSKKDADKKEDEEEEKDDNAVAKKDPRAPKKKEEKQEIAVVDPQKNPIQPNQQVFFGYNPVTQEPAHYGPMPTAQQPAPEPQVPVKEDDNVDIDEIFAGLFTEEQQNKVETALENMGEEKAKKILESEEFKNGFNALINMLTTSEKEEGVKNNGKKTARSKK